MSKKLSSLLLKNNAVTLEKMEEAFQRQVIYGGRLGTTLLEMGVLDEETILNFLSESQSLPAADQSMFLDVEQEAVQLLSLEESRELSLLPIRRYKQDIKVLVTDPLSPELSLSLGNRMGYCLKQYLVLDFRFQHALKCFRGLKPGARVQQLIKRFPLEMKLSGDEKAPPPAESSGPVQIRRTPERLMSETDIDDLGSEVIIALSKSLEAASSETSTYVGSGGASSALGSITVNEDEPFAIPLPVEEESFDKADPVISPFGHRKRSVRNENSVQYRSQRGINQRPMAHTTKDNYFEDDKLGYGLTTNQFSEALEQSSERDEILALLMGYLKNFASRRALFLVSKQQFKGYVNSGFSTDDTEFKSQLFQIEPGTLIGDACQTGSFYLGTSNYPGLTEVMHFLSRVPGPDMGIFPIEIANKTALLVFMDNGEEPLDGENIPMVLLAVNHVSKALKQLILSKKSKQQANTNTAKPEYRVSSGSSKIPHIVTPSLSQEIRGPKSSHTLGAHLGLALKSSSERKGIEEIDTAIPESQEEQPATSQYSESELGLQEVDNDQTQISFGPRAGRAFEEPEEWKFSQGESEDKKDSTFQQAKDTIETVELNKVEQPQKKTKTQDQAPVPETTAAIEAPETKTELKYTDEEALSYLNSKKFKASKKFFKQLKNKKKISGQEETDITAQVQTHPETESPKAPEAEQKTAPKINPQKTVPQTAKKVGPPDWKSRIRKTTNKTNADGTSDFPSGGWTLPSDLPTKLPDSVANKVFQLDNKKIKKSPQSVLNKSDSAKKTSKQDDDLVELMMAATDSEEPKKQQTQAKHTKSVTQKPALQKGSPQRPGVTTKPVTKLTEEKTEKQSIITINTLEPLEIPKPDTLDKTIRKKVQRQTLDGRSKIMPLTNSTVMKIPNPSDQNQENKTTDRTRDSRKTKKHTVNLKSLAANLNHPNHAVVQSAMKNLLSFGPEALGAIMDFFPGNLKYDRYQLDMNNIPPVEQHSAILQTLVTMGPQVAPELYRIMGSPSVDKRFYATLLLSKIKGEGTIHALADRIFDRDVQVRTVAISLLCKLKRNPEFPDVLNRFRNLVADYDEVDERQQEMATVVLGKLRDEDCILSLIDLLKIKNKRIVQSAYKSLVQITLDDFGTKARKWKRWWKKHGSTNRHFWIVTALNHKKLHIRMMAQQELNQYRGLTLNYNPEAHKKIRIKAQEQLRQWLSTHGVI